MKFVHYAAALALLGAPAPSFAGDKRIVHPVQVGSESVRFEQGVATVDLEKGRGAVQITPLPFDHGSLSFSVAVLNSGTEPANIDIFNFVSRAGAQELPVFSKDELESKAKNRAMWASIALAAVGGLGAAAAASQRDHYRSTLLTPRGTYRYSFSAPSTAGQIQAAALVAGTGYGIAQIQSRLDATRAALGANIVQLTTVDPGESYAGQIVLTKIKAKALPQRVDMVVRWNGEEFPFAFLVAKRGTAAPEWKPIAVSSPAAPAEPASTLPPVAAAPAATTSTP